MPRYFFQVCDGRHFPDTQGTELADISAARRQALIFAGRLLADEPDRLWDVGEWRMRITDAHDLTLFELMFVTTSAAAITPDPMKASFASGSAD